MKANFLKWMNVKCYDEIGKLMVDYDRTGDRFPISPCMYIIFKMCLCWEG